MTGYIGKTTNWSRDVTGRQTLTEREQMWGEIPGKIVNFNAETQTATIKPLYKPMHNGEPVDMPDLLDVPVRFQRMGGFVITTPVKEGNNVVLRPQMRSTENYHEDGEYTPSDGRSFSLADYEAFLDGGESLQQPIKNFNNTNLEIRSEDGQFAMEMSESGKFRMRGAAANWFDLLARLAELLAADQLQINYGSSAGSGHELQFRSEYAEIAGQLRAMAL